jgi:glycosyltransferase involved in cell wall biosynthesis
MGSPKLTGLIGSGLIGADPFGPKAWSGSSAYFFRKCNEFGILDVVLGFEAAPARRAALMLKNFSFSRKTWRDRFYLDTAYYEALTKAALKRIRDCESDSDLLQIGGIYNIAQNVHQKVKCYSYHDGNLAQVIKSPYKPKSIPTAVFEKALNYESNVYRALDKIFTMSEYLRKSFIEDFGIADEKVITIGAGVNLDEIPNLHDKNYEKKNLFFLGVDFERKGGWQLIRAFKRVRSVFPETKLHIVGPPSLNIGAEFSEGIVFHGFLSRKNPVQKHQFETIVHESSLFVMPSLYEPFGIAPLETMLYQLPCVLTDRWAFPEMVRPGYNGELVAVGDVEDLAERVIHLLKDPVSLRTMGRNAREFVLSNYTWDHVVRRLVAAVS